MSFETEPSLLRVLYYVSSDDYPFRELRIRPQTSLLSISLVVYVNIYVKNMPHVLFIWNDELVEYIAQHGVTSRGQNDE